MKITGTPNSSFVFHGVPRIPSWEKASKTAVSIFSSLGNKNDRRLKLRFLPDRSAVFIRIEEPVLEDVPFGKVKEKPYPSYSADDECHLGNLIIAFDEANIFVLATSIPRFVKLGKPIAHLHPLTFMQMVIGNPRLRTQFQRVFNHPLKRMGFLHGNGIIKGFRHQLERKVARGDLEPHIDSFSSHLRASPEKVRSLIQEQAWSELYFYLFETASGHRAQEFLAR